MQIPLDRALALTALLVTSALAAWPCFAQTASVVSKFGEWSLLISGADAQKLCFAATKPTESEPKGANRAPVYFYISAWPKDGVKSEVSIKLGYPIKKGSDVTLTIGDANFTLFGKDDRAFVSDPTNELKLVEAMKKGSKMTVQGTSERGTATIDTYSLSGISQALQALATGCP